MRNIRSRLARVVLVGIAVLAVAACGSDAEPEAEKAAPPLKVGFLLTDLANTKKLLGHLGADLAEQRAAYQAFVDETNEAGGIGGRMIERCSPRSTRSPATPVPPAPSSPRTTRCSGETIGILSSQAGDDDVAVKTAMIPTLEQLGHPVAHFADLAIDAADHVRPVTADMSCTCWMPTGEFQKMRY